MRCKAPAGRACLVARCCYAPPRFKRRMERSAKAAPLHSLSCEQVVHLSRPRLGVRLPMQHYSNSMQTCNRNQTSPCAWKARPPCKKTSPFSCKTRYWPLTFPDDLHETSRAMQSSRRPHISCRTISICCLTLGKHCYAPPRSKRRMERSAKAAPFHSLFCEQVVHFEPTATMGPSAHVALFLFDTDMQ